MLRTLIISSPSWRLLKASILFPWILLTKYRHPRTIPNLSSLRALLRVYLTGGWLSETITGCLRRRTTWKNKPLICHSSKLNFDFLTKLTKSVDSRIKRSAEFSIERITGWPLTLIISSCGLKNSQNVLIQVKYKWSYFWEKFKSIYSSFPSAGPFLITSQTIKACCSNSFSSA